MKSLGFGLLGIFVSLLMVGTMMVPDAAMFRDPSLARIMFSHFPSAVICSALFVGAAWHGAAYLRKGADVSAAKMNAAVELGMIFAVLTMATGILFSQVQWGDWWHNDPRQVSFLIVLFIYAGLLGVRGAFGDSIRRDRTTSAYALAAVLPAIFLIFIYPRLSFVKQQSFHPTDTIAQNQLDIIYSSALYSSLILLSIITVIIFRIRVRTELLERNLENYGNNETHRGNSASSRVVRPVAVSSED